ncbi:MAG: DUF554 domain-containing protein [Treponema sp.]|nr:DUF554 domain-containing protein [Treponema sp.]
MLGTIVNTCTILLGSIIGSLLKKGIKEKYQTALFTAMGLAACAIGVNAVCSHMGKSQYPVLFIVSLAVGSLAGTILNLDERFQNLVNKHSGEGTNLGQGLATGILMYCIGTLSILGPVMAAVSKDYTYLFTNATLDFVTSMVLASTYGIGMTLAAPVLFCWQGSIYLISKFCSASFFNETLLCELSIVGGIMIFASGLGILNIKNCKTLNILPSLFIPILFFIAKMIFKF